MSEIDRTVLISGASIAGNTAAYWLARRGWAVMVIERTPEFRDGGQNIDVRGVGREVLRRMGLEQAALDGGTGEQGTVWVDGDGHPVASFMTADMAGDGPTAELEILRGDLARLLYDAARGQVTYRFGTTIAAARQDGSGVAITFDDGGEQRFDAVVIAEGVGSATRELIFAGENEPRWMDETIAYFTIPRAPDDEPTWRWYHATGGRTVSLRPDNHGTQRAMLSIHGQSQGKEDWDPAQQQAWLRERFADAGWQTPRVLAGMADTDDFYFDVLRQVRLPRWSHGRIAVTGDAAWCATPLAGIGTTLAIAGAYVLAEELARAENPAAGFAAYEAAIRPTVEDGQGVPKLAPRLMHPRSRLGIMLLHGALKAASTAPVRDAFAKLFASEPVEPDLSRYRRD